ncbi:transmembrane protein 135-like [Ornithodoros turicata]|uniref:transmembrane protein 135-like n=1 Tax=Ornithodoros turicata TaxID=34597 RepID=UPI003138CAEF
MGNAASRLWELQLPYNCYETLHTWTPTCSLAWVDLFENVFKTCLPLNVTLNLTGVAMSQNWKAVPRAVLLGTRSSLSVAYCLFFSIALSCTLRELTGSYSIVPQLGSAFLGCYMGILYEDPKRHRALLVYMLNLTSETIFRLLQDSGRFQGFSQGQTLLFALSLAGYIYLCKNYGLKRDPVKRGLRILLGDPELRDREVTTQQHLCNNHSCLYTSLSRFLVWSIIACIGSSALRSGTALLRGRRVPRPIVQGTSLQLGLFVGAMSGLYNITRCALKRWSSTGEEEAWHSAAAGFVGGLAMAVWPSQRAAVYLLWKCLEGGYLVGLERGKLPGSQNATPVLFAACCALLFGAGALKPQAIRPSYLAFIDRIAGHRLNAVNWAVIRSLGYETPELFPDTESPALDPRFLTKQYKENFWVWGRA